MAYLKREGKVSCQREQESVETLVSWVGGVVVDKCCSKKSCILRVL